MAIPIALDLREQVRIRLREGTLINPYDIAREIAIEMTDDELREMAAGLLVNVVREQIHTERSRKQPTTSAAPGSPRWEQVKRARSRLDMPWAPNGEWKRLRDCTRKDIDHLIADYAKRASTNAAWRDAFRRVANEMGEREVETVGELPVDFVEGVLP